MLSENNDQQQQNSLVKFDANDSCKALKRLTRFGEKCVVTTKEKN
jgi:hypothetical protein